MNSVKLVDESQYPVVVLLNHGSQVSIGGVITGVTSE